MSNDEAATILTQLEKKNNKINYKRQLGCSVLPDECKVRRFRNFRSLDGTCNNLKSPCLGAAFTPFNRLLAPAYANGKSRPPTRRNFIRLPNAREFSNSVSNICFLFNTNDFAWELNFLSFKNALSIGKTWYDNYYQNERRSTREQINFKNNTTLLNMSFKFKSVVLFLKLIYYQNIFVYRSWRVFKICQ